MVLLSLPNVFVIILDRLALSSSKVEVAWLPEATSDIPVSDFIGTVKLVAEDFGMHSTTVADICVGGELDTPMMF